MYNKYTHALLNILFNYYNQHNIYQFEKGVNSSDKDSHILMYMIYAEVISLLKVC
jgi:hypothetical protein